MKIVIIGGGVIGLSTAYHLAQRRGTKIMLVEKDVIGAGASSRAAGIITDLLWTRTGILARQRSLQLFAKLSAELDGYRFRNSGCLNLFNSERWRDRTELLSLYTETNTAYEVLDAAAMRTRWPSLRWSDDWIGLYDPMGGYSEPDEYIPALARRVQQLGVDLLERTPVRSLVLDQGCAVGVRTQDRLLDADAVVVTVHAWAEALLSELGYRAPVKTFVHQRFLSTSLDEALSLPAINANPLDGYLRPAADNRLLVGVETAMREEMRVDSLGFQMDSLDTPSVVASELHTAFCDFVPALSNHPWAEQRIGLIAFTMDGEPLLGPVKAVPGLFVGLGFHSGGFAYNPVAGELLADYVYDGRPRLDVRTFSPDRFQPDQTAAYLAETAVQADAVQRRH